METILTQKLLSGQIKVIMGNKKVTNETNVRKCFELYNQFPKNR